MKDVLLVIRLLRQQRISADQLRASLDEWGQTPDSDLADILVANQVLSHDESQAAESSLQSMPTVGGRALSVQLLSEIVQALELTQSDKGAETVANIPAAVHIEKTDTRWHLMLRLLIAFRDGQLAAEELTRSLAGLPNDLDPAIAKRLETNDLATEFHSLLASAGGSRETALGRVLADIARRQNAATETHGTPLNTRFRRGNRFAVGGQGVLHRAFDRHLECSVAIKTLKPELQGNQGAALRLLDEARVTAQLAHQGIPPVYAIGTEADPYCAMKLVKGNDLYELIDVHHSKAWKKKQDRGRPIPKLEELVDYLRNACDTIQRVHDANKLHLDLKSANIRVEGVYREVFVLDFGLAEPRMEEFAVSWDEVDEEGLEDSETSDVDVTEQRTQVSIRDKIGGFKGTPQYMSKEQANGNYDYHCDIFGLGAVLYEILTGQPPLVPPKTRSPEQLVRFVRDAKIVAPSEIASDVPPALEAICLCATHDDHKRVRYQSVEGLKEDLERWARGQEVKAWERLNRPEPNVDRLTRTALENRGKLIATLTAGVLLAIAVPTALSIQAAQAKRQARLEASWARITNQAYTSLFGFVAPEAPDTLFGVARNLTPGQLDRLKEIRDEYDGFIQKNNRKDVKTIYLARAHLVIARITQLMPAQAADASHDRAAAAHRGFSTAVSLYREHLRNKPNDTAAKRELATALLADGRSLKELEVGSPSKPANELPVTAEERNAGAIEIRKRIVDAAEMRSPDDPNLDLDRVLLANAYMNAGALANQRDPDASEVALRWFDEALDVMASCRLDTHHATHGEILRANARLGVNRAIVIAGQFKNKEVGLQIMLEACTLAREKTGRLVSFGKDATRFEDVHLDCVARLMLLRAETLRLDGLYHNGEPENPSEQEKLHVEFDDLLETEAAFSKLIVDENVKRLHARTFEASTASALFRGGKLMQQRRADKLREFQRINRETDYLKSEVEAIDANTPALRQQELIDQFSRTHLQIAEIRVMYAESNPGPDLNPEPILAIGRAAIQLRIDSASDDQKDQWGERAIQFEERGEELRRRYRKARDLK